MYSLYKDFQHTEPNISIALVPIKDFNINKKLVLEEYIIYPKGTLDIEEIGKITFDFTFEEKKNLFFDSTLMAIPTNYNRPLFISPLLPDQKTKLINTVLESAEDIMNIFRFIFCNWDKNSNLPQRAGFLSDMTSGFLLCHHKIDAFSFIYDKYITQNYSLSNGLYVDIEDSYDLLKKYFLTIKHESFEVASIIKHAFRIYSNILYLPTSTNKFMQGMSMIEYLANPFEYVKMQDVKTKIVPFSVDSKKKYHEVCERFKYLTSLKNDNDEQIGLRTCIVHNGKNLEQLISENYKIDMLLRELQMYVTNFIDCSIIYTNCNWGKIVEKVEEKYTQLQSIKTGYEGKLEADVAFLIDINFLNKALEEVYLWYPQHKEVKFDITVFLMLVSKQVNLRRKEYQIPVQLFYSQDVEIYNSKSKKNISQYEALGFNSDYGEYSIYTLNTNSVDSHHDVMHQSLEYYLKDYNYILNPSGKYSNIVFISDRNSISDEPFIYSEKSHKKITLGRLDNKRTTSYDKLIWFDIQLTIMTTLGIEHHEQCANNFIFKVEDGRYQGA